MSEAAKVPGQAFVESMRRETERVLSEVMRAANDAPDGAWINGSEWQVHDAFEELRRLTYERALRMRTQKAEGAFSPGGRVRGQGQG
jgi:hypothetical protein